MRCLEIYYGLASWPGLYVNISTFSTAEWPDEFIYFVWYFDGARISHHHSTPHFYHSSHAHIEGVILQATSIDDLADAQMLWHGVVVDFLLVRVTLPSKNRFLVSYNCCVDSFSCCIKVDICWEVSSFSVANSWKLCKFVVIISHHGGPRGAGHGGWGHNEWAIPWGREEYLANSFFFFEGPRNNSTLLG